MSREATRINTALRSVLDSFELDGAPVSCERNGSGHINETYLVETESGRRYTLHKINENVFRDVEGLMDNIARVTEHLHRCSSDPRSALRLVPTRSGGSHIKDERGAWRMYDYIDGAICLLLPETDEDFYQSAVAFGSFQQRLRDFPAETLHEVIPDFHNTPDRYRIFKEALARDSEGRAAALSEEIDFFLSREEEMAELQNLRAGGELPVRVTHNDTKLSNVLLDSVTRKALCVIDLDTVMPGLSLYDFGDSIRFGAATALEDERDLDKMTMSLELYRIYTEGFVRSYPGLTAAELEYLPMGAKTMTLECGLRFLTDHIDGDHYFSIHRPGHNLDRARTQIKLVRDMEAKWDGMRAITAEIAGRQPRHV